MTCVPKCSKYYKRAKLKSHIKSTFMLSFHHSPDIRGPGSTRYAWHKWKQKPFHYEDDTPHLVTPSVLIYNM